MKRNRLTVLAILIGIGFWVSPAAAPAAAPTFTTIDDPLETPGQGTACFGISGSNVVGSYTTSNFTYGFLYNGTTYTTLKDPSAYASTACYGISGSNIVGTYSDSQSTSHGFLYNGTTYTTLDDPFRVYGTEAWGIDGNNIVGSYDSLNSQQQDVRHGFLYNISTQTYTTLDDPLGVGSTFACAISGSNIVGTFWDSTKAHGFLYNISTQTYTTLDDPLGIYGTEALGISGNNIVGCYFVGPNEPYGFLFNGTTYQTINNPFAGYSGGYVGTEAYGISGNNVVGEYFDVNGFEHGFIATSIPEPSTVVLLIVGAIGLIGCRWRQRQKRSLSLTEEHTRTGQEETGPATLSLPSYRTEAKRMAA